jgi:glycosyltransferase involved in cell wall biosynthesis
VHERIRTILGAQSNEYSSLLATKIFVPRRRLKAMPKKRDILFISSWFPNALAPTLGNFVERHAEAISTMHRVFVVHVVPDSSRLWPRFVYRQQGDLHIGILYHPAIRPHRWFRRFFFDFAYRRMRTAVGFTPELVHVNVLHPMGDIAVRMAERMNLPLVATEHWTGYHPNTHNHLSRQQWTKLTQVAAKCAVICPVSEHLAKAMKARGLDGDFRVIGNVVDTELFTHPAERKTKKQLLHVSNLLDVHKNVSGILRAFKAALAHDEELHLTIIGDGDLAPHRQLASELKLPPHALTFQGTTSIEGIAKAMQTAGALVLFSNYENLPCVIGEALATGLPVISTTVGGIPEHLNAQRGWLIEPQDEAGLTQAMLAVGVSGERFNTEALSAYSVEHFSREAIAKAYTDVYLSALNTHRR